MGLARAGRGGIRLDARVGYDGADAEVFAAGTPRCSGCAVRVGEPSPPRYALRIGILVAETSPRGRGGRAGAAALRSAR